MPYLDTVSHELSRRRWLARAAGGLGSLSLVGISPPLGARTVSAAQPAVGRGSLGGSFGKAKSVIVLFNTGGMPQHEAWDPKPDAPREVRGEFGTIATRTPGLFVGELMPKTAQLTDKIAVIRTMVTGDNSHSSSGYQMLTGVPHIPLSRENAKPGKPNDQPAIGAIVQALRAPKGGLPASISLPRRLANNGGQDPWPGTDGGILGHKVDPWLMECDPSEAGFRVPGGELRDGMTADRLTLRRGLLDALNLGGPAAEGTTNSIAPNPVAEFNFYKRQAVDMIAGGEAQRVFELERESDKMRDAYGRHQHGQSVLLARRLVEAGASYVQVHWASYDKSKPNNGGWDTHEKHSESLKDWLMPGMDQTYSALITDLEQRGLLDETLVCWVSEFGHTPKFNARGGRDHWGKVFSIALAGGGVRGGVVHGQSDDRAAEPLGDVVTPADYLATIYHCLGYEPETIVHDLQGRPLPISRGTPVRQVLA
ncbi:MAG: DUF1501 domain-containing protein [Planctomycetes bacterium]|nr:DUF1501 domain-containing protein [Planctomycetota bacterium]